MTDLITRLSKLDAPDREVDAEIAETFGYPQEVFGSSFGNAYVDGPDMHYDAATWSGEGKSWSAPYFTSSVDAAIELAARVLPGWVFDNVGQDFHSVPGGYEAFGWNVELINGTRVQGQSPTFPIAICIALLRAKEASL